MDNTSTAAIADLSAAFAEAMRNEPEDYRDLRQSGIYRREYADAITGRGTFFSDCADECMDALIRSYRIVGATREQRGAYLDGAIRAIAHDYADSLARSEDYRDSQAIKAAL